MINMVIKLDMLEKIHDLTHCVGIPIGTISIHINGQILDFFAEHYMAKPFH